MDASEIERQPAASPSTAPAPVANSPPLKKTTVDELPVEVIYRIFELVEVCPGDAIAPATVGKQLSTLSSSTREAGQRLVFRDMAPVLSTAPSLADHIMRYPRLGSYIRTLEVPYFRMDEVLDPFLRACVNLQALSIVIGDCLGASELLNEFDRLPPLQRVTIGFKSVRDLGALASSLARFTTVQVYEFSYGSLGTALRADAPVLSARTLTLDADTDSDTDRMAPILDTVLSYFVPSSLRALNLSTPSLSSSTIVLIQSFINLSSLTFSRQSDETATAILFSLLPSLSMLSSLRKLAFRSPPDEVTHFVHPLARVTLRSVLSSLPPRLSHLDIVLLDVQRIVPLPQASGTYDEEVVQNLSVMVKRGSLEDGTLELHRLGLVKVEKGGVATWCEAERVALLFP
ncbi:hypothetical protein JCM6882_000417 [Rhodosporidiobolus microsporus]